MVLNGLFDPLWLDADVTLCGGGTAVLQEPLDKGNVIAVRLVDWVFLNLEDQGCFCMICLDFDWQGNG